MATNRILQALKKKGWSQGMLARAAGLDRMYINKLIHKTKHPSIWTALKVAKALGVRVEDIWKP